jgi:hypothetical protein
MQHTYSLFQLPQKTDREEAFQHYCLPTLLAADDILVLNPSGGLISLLHSPIGKQANIKLQRPFPPYPMQAVELLIQFAPTWCPYSILIERFFGLHLSPAEVENLTQEQWKTQFRPLRTAMKDANTLLAPFNLGTAVLPRVGYQLVRRSDLFTTSSNARSSSSHVKVNRVISLFSAFPDEQRK